MIKINKSIIVIISLSLFLFLCYNVLTAEAKVDLNKEYTWTNADGTKDKVTLQDFEVEDVEESCDASEDYTRNEKLCDELYKMKEESDEANKKQQQENIEKACDKAGAKLNEKGECNIHGDGPKADKFYEEQAKLEQEEKSVINEDGRNTVTTSEDEGKRYVNPDGGAPLYEDELTEEEKDVYTEYKPEKEKVEDWKNTADIEPELNQYVNPSHIEETDSSDANTNDEDDEDIADYNEADNSNDEDESHDEDESDDEEESDDSGDSGEEESSEE